MTDRELMQRVLFNLEHILSFIEDFGDKEDVSRQHKLIADLYARLAQPELYKQPEDSRLLMQAYRAIHKKQPEPEPVAWGIVNTRPTEKNPLMMVMLYEPEPSHLVVPLYAASPQRKWQELTDEDRADAWAQTKGDLLLRLLPFSLAIEAKLKEKNEFTTLPTM